MVCFSPLVFHRSPRLPLSSGFDCTSCHSSSTLSASFCWFSIVPLIYHCSLVIYPPLVCRSHPGLPSSPGLPWPHAPSSAIVFLVCHCPHGLPLSPWSAIVPHSPISLATIVPLVFRRPAGLYSSLLLCLSTSDLPSSPLVYHCPPSFLCSLIVRLFHNRQRILSETPAVFVSTSQSYFISFFFPRIRSLPATGIFCLLLVEVKESNKTM